MPRNIKSQIRRLLNLSQNDYDRLQEIGLYKYFITSTTWKLKNRLLHIAKNREKYLSWNIRVNKNGYATNMSYVTIDRYIKEYNKKFDTNFKTISEVKEHQVTRSFPPFKDPFENGITDKTIKESLNRPMDEVMNRASAQNTLKSWWKQNSLPNSIELKYKPEAQTITKWVDYLKNKIDEKSQELNKQRLDEAYKQSRNFSITINHNVEPVTFQRLGDNDIKTYIPTTNKPEVHIESESWTSKDIIDSMAINGWYVDNNISFVGPTRKPEYIIKGGHGREQDTINQSGQRLADELLSGFTAHYKVTYPKHKKIRKPRTIPEPKIWEIKVLDLRQDFAERKYSTHQIQLPKDIYNRKIGKIARHKRPKIPKEKHFMNRKVMVRQDYSDKWEYIDKTDPKLKNSDSTKRNKRNRDYDIR